MRYMKEGRNKTLEKEEMIGTQRKLLKMPPGVTKRAEK